MLHNAAISYIFLYVRDLASSRRFYENKLGLRVLEVDAQAVKYDAGDVMLALNRAADFGVALHDAGPSDCLLVFYTPDIEKAAAEISSGGADVGAIDRYEIGAVAEIKDPDGHSFSLYEPSAEALTWPSADKIRDILAAQRAKANQPATLRRRRAGKLGGCNMVYLFLFVRDPAEAAAFYGEVLGLHRLESSACSAGGPDNGVVKYDGGSIILTTHVSDSLASRPANPSVHKGVAVVFNVTDIERVADELGTRGLKFETDVVSADIGKIIQFRDPNNHRFYLHEPSIAAWKSPSGEKVRQLLTKYVS